MTQPPSYYPDISDVANLIYTRTKDSLGHELGTFTADTRPTDTQVTNIIDQAAQDIEAMVDTDIPEGAYDYVEQSIACRAAMIIERSFFPEQIASDRSAYTQLRDDCKERFDAMIAAVQREQGEEVYGELPLAGSPSGSFPPPELRYRLGRPI